MFVGGSFIVNQFDHLEADYLGYLVHNEVKDKNNRSQAKLNLILVF